MQTTLVTSNGQITIPKKLRQQFGISKGSKIIFHTVGNRIELQVSSTPVSASSKNGFGMLKSDRKSVPDDFDPAKLLKV